MPLSCSTYGRLCLYTQLAPDVNQLCQIVPVRGQLWELARIEIFSQKDTQQANLAV